MRFVLAVAGFAACATAIPAADLDLKPANTYVVIAGVLQWPGNVIPGFPTKNRKDEELHDVLLKSGVPAENMKLLLDEQATHSGVKRAIREVAAKANKDSLFVFYYCGHGLPHRTGGVCLANYDLKPGQPDLTGLLATDLTAMIRDNYKGKRVLFLADCCFSGGLGKAAEGLNKAGYEAAYLTSANDAMVSTNNWTFTQTVIDAVTGDTFADANADGVVTLDELAGDVRKAMESLERQKHGYKSFGLAGKFTLATAAKKAKAADGVKFPPGEFVLAPDGRANRAGRVVGGADGKAVVQFYDYTEKRRVEVPEGKLSAIPDGWLKVRTAAAEIEVEWKGKWFPAVVLKKDGEKSLIHYVNFGDEWDEWVTAERVRAIKK
jgi:hypothetical protein